MARVYLVLALLLTVFWVYSIVDCALQPALRHRGVPKTAWIFIVVLLPVLGGILWFVIGRARRSTAPRFQAPDDNPEFLGSISLTADQDERIRRLEEELAALDSEAEDPRDQPRTDPTAEPPAGDDDSDESTRGGRA
jgi:hypothetical protein